MIPPTMQWPAPVRRHTRSVVASVLGVSFAVLIISTAMLLIRRPPVVDEVRVVNRSGLTVDVEVKAEGVPGRMPLSIIQPRRVDITEDVIDQGDVWIFIVEHEGREIYRVRMSRAELVREHWRVVIPETVEASSRAERVVVDVACTRGVDRCPQ